jgi:hypothetical protein
MMKRNHKRMERLERGLAKAHRDRDVPALGADWAQGVMRDIRRAAAHSPGEQGAWMELCVWRSAAAAAAFAAFLAGSAFFYAGADQGELTALLSEDLEPGPALIE